MTRAVLCFRSRISTYSSMNNTFFFFPAIQEQQNLDFWKNRKSVARECSFMRSYELGLKLATEIGHALYVTLSFSSFKTALVLSWAWGSDSHKKILRKKSASQPVILSERNRKCIKIGTHFIFFSEKLTHWEITYSQHYELCRYLFKGSLILRIPFHFYIAPKKALSWKYTL